MTKEEQRELMKELKKEAKEFKRIRAELFEMFEEHFDYMRDEYIFSGKQSTEPRYTEGRASGLWDARQGVFLDRVAKFVMRYKNA